MAKQRNHDQPPTDRPVDHDGPGGHSTSGAVDAYGVGNKHPPRHTQFRPGQSGNPKGRPPKSRNLKNDLLDELSETIRIREGDRHRKISKQRALLKAGFNRGLGGDVKALAWVFGLVARLIDNMPPSDAEQTLEPSDLAIIEDFIARKLATRAARNQAAASEEPGDGQ